MPILALLLLSTGVPLSAQADTILAGRKPGAVGSAILGGTLGSAAGALVGMGVGAGLDVVLDRCDSEDPYGEGSFCAIVPGVFLGAILGSALGAKLFAERKGAHPRFGRVLWAAAGGSLVGLITSGVVFSLTRDGRAGLIGFSIGQGFVAGLYAGSK
jgi:hypothetical protein